MIIPFSASKFHQWLAGLDAKHQNPTPNCSAHHQKLCWAEVGFDNESSVLPGALYYSTPHNTCSLTESCFSHNWAHFHQFYYLQSHRARTKSYSSPPQPGPNWYPPLFEECKCDLQPKTPFKLYPKALHAEPILTDLNCHEICHGTTKVLSLQHKPDTSLKQGIVSLVWDKYGTLITSLLWHGARFCFQNNHGNPWLRHSYLILACNPTLLIIRIFGLLFFCHKGFKVGCWEICSWCWSSFGLLMASINT